MRSLIRDAAITVAASLVFMIVFELGLRTFFPQELSGTRIRGEHFSEPDPHVGIRYIPGAEWRFDHPEYSVEYAINADGLRDATDRPRVTPEGTTRILLLGDSFTFGQGVNYEDTWPVMAERMLARAGLGHIDLIKAGRQGMDTRSELQLLRILAPKYRPDAVLVGFLINDLYSNLPSDSSASAAWDTTRARIFHVAGTAQSLHSVILARRLLISTNFGYIRLYLAAPERGEYLKRPLSPKPQRQLGVTKTLLLELAALCDSLGMPLYVLSIPQQFQVIYPPDATSGVDVDLYDSVFGGLAKDRSFSWVPTLAAFRAASSGPPLFHRLDGHLTAAGNAVVAKVFVQDIVPRAVAEIKARAGKQPLAW